MKYISFTNILIQIHLANVHISATDYFILLLYIQFGTKFKGGGQPPGSPPWIRPCIVCSRPRMMNSGYNLRYTNKSKATRMSPCRLSPGSLKVYNHGWLTYITDKRFFFICDYLRLICPPKSCYLLMNLFPNTRQLPQKIKQHILYVLRLRNHNVS